MAKSDITKLLEKELYKRIDARKDFACHEVTLGWMGKEIVDFITYSFDRQVKCYEIKVSKSDFNSKAKLSFFGNYNYFVMPMELWEEIKMEVKPEIGVFAYDGRTLVSVKRAWRQELRADKEVILSSMLRSMQRELLKEKELTRGKENEIET